MKKIRLIFISLLALVAAACQEDVKWPETNSAIEENDGTRLSYFDLSKKLFDSYESAAFANLKSGFGNLISCPTAVKPSGLILRCALHLSGESLPDGIYLLTFSDSENKPLPGMVKLTVKEERVVAAENAPAKYSLRQGSGTEDDPYIIGSSRDFLTFLDDLRKDELTNGRELWFKQTADIKLMDQGDKPGRGYYGYSFAGHYDGGGYALSELYYHGGEDASSDSKLGLFPTILDGAVVKNLKLTSVNVTNVSNDVGALAGVSVGYVEVSDVTVQGSIITESGNNIGGLIGRLEKGTLSVEDVKLKMTLKGQSGIGGVLGRMDTGSLKIDGVNTPDYHFSVEGHGEVGGVLGKVKDGAVDISSVNLEHVVSTEDSDIRSVGCGVGGNAGGVVGIIEMTSSPVTFKDITVACPVGSTGETGSKVGGIIGSVFSSGNLTFSGCRMTSIVSAEDYVGGYAGQVKLTENATLNFGGDYRDSYIVPDNSAAVIKGKDMVGGAFGFLGAPHVKGENDAVRVALNVEASGLMCGGVIGMLESTDIDLSIFKMTSSTMKVSGNWQVGGMVGYVANSTVRGSTPFDYPVTNGRAKVPEAKDFEPLYIGVVTGSLDVGGIVGQCYNSSIKALSSKCTVTSTGGENFGGIVGRFTVDRVGNKVMEDLTSSSLVSASSCNYVGGICGLVEGDCYTRNQDCINYGEVNGGNYVGGIIGAVNRQYDGNGTTTPDIGKTSWVAWCYNASEVKGNNCVGGIVGKIDISLFGVISYQVTVENCGNSGKISASCTGSVVSGVGGIVGNSSKQHLIQKCANKGYIYATGPHKAVGGIAGSLGNDPKGAITTYTNVALYECTNTGTVDAKDNETRVGGVLGFMEEGPDSNVEFCLNGGKVLNKHKSDNGGIVGYVDHLSYTFNSVNLGDVEHGNATIGTHKTGSSFYHEGLYFLDGTGKDWPNAIRVSQANIGDKSYFSHLNFEKTWDISPDGPYLRNCPFAD